jgi:TPR repeat protein
MIWRTAIAALAVVLTSVMPAFSEYALDVGANTCTKWVEAREVRGGLADVTHTAWLYGYLSAAAARLQGEARSAVFLGKNDQRLIEKADILRSIEATAINAWMDQYCQAHPLNKIADALHVLVSELKQKTGYLQEAVCEISDLKEEGRASCRRAFEETKRSAEASQRHLDTFEIAQLMKRGDELVAAGNIGAARSMFQLAAGAGEPTAALALAETYDPSVLEKLGAKGITPNVSLARYWYEKAKALGSTAAPGRLVGLMP